MLGIGLVVGSRLVQLLQFRVVDFPLLFLTDFSTIQGQSVMTFSPWTSGSTRLGGRQEVGTFGIKSSVRQRSNKEEE